MSEGIGSRPEGQRSFPPVDKPQRGAFEHFVRGVTGRNARERKQNLANLRNYAGLVRRIDERNLQLSTPSHGNRAEQNLIAGACRLAFETGNTVSLRSPEGSVDAISPDAARKILTEVAMTFPQEMQGDQVDDDGQPTEETLRYCAARIVAALTHDDEYTRFYDSMISGTELRTRFTNLQTELSNKEQ